MTLTLTLTMTMILALNTDRSVAVGMGKKKKETITGRSLEGLGDRVPQYYSKFKEQEKYSCAAVPVLTRDRLVAMGGC